LKPSISGAIPLAYIYFFKDVLFTCDYVFLKGETLKFNPYGPEKETKEGGHRINELITGKQLNKICGYNYVIDYQVLEREI